MKARKLELGDRNIVGAHVTEARLAKKMKQKICLRSCKQKASKSARLLFLYWRGRSVR